MGISTKFETDTNIITSLSGLKAKRSWLSGFIKLHIKFDNKVETGSGVLITYNVSRCSIINKVDQCMVK